MNLWNEADFAALNSAQRRAVEKRAAAAGQTALDYLNALGAGVAAVNSYAAEDRAADADFFRPFVERSLDLSPAARLALAGHIRNLVAGESLDTADLDLIIEQITQGGGTQ